VSDGFVFMTKEQASKLANITPNKLFLALISHRRRQCMQWAVDITYFSTSLCLPRCRIFYNASFPFLSRFQLRNS